MQWMTALLSRHPELAVYLALAAGYWIGTRRILGFTLGGVATTVDGQARRPDGSVIPGLYAAGPCASNIAQDGKGYASGTQLGEGSFFGRRAGRHAAHISLVNQ